MTYPVHTIETAPEGSRPVLEKLSEELSGFLPNLAAAMSNSPALLTAFTTARSINQKTSLSALEREVVALVTSLENACAYCMAAHSAFAAKAGADEAGLAALRIGGLATGNPRLDALARFTRRVLTAKGELPQHDIESFVSGGFTREQALEVIVGIAMTSIANHAAHITGAPVDEAFAQFTWSPAARPTGGGTLS
jgi:uncharacterized peroxidase-related enzyme